MLPTWCLVVLLALLSLSQTAVTQPYLRRQLSQDVSPDLVKQLSAALHLRQLEHDLGLSGHGASAATRGAAISKRTFMKTFMGPLMELGGNQQKEGDGQGRQGRLGDSPQALLEALG